MGIESCIDQQDLKAFALGHLDEDRSEAIAAHLSACARCEETMAGFDDTDDSMLAAVREAAGEPAALATAIPAEAVLQQIANPWSGAGNAEKPASTGEWIRDYELLEPLGHGGMGTVYKAVHARLQRPVAIKLLPSRRLRDPDAVARFEREMKAIGRLDHPAIVRATDAGDADGTHFLVMDYVDGIDLSQLIKLTGPIDVASACEVIRQAAIGLQYAHEQGLIHRDVKPSNLMMEVSLKDGQGSSTRDKTATVKLLDLGLALFGAASEAVDELTTVGQLMGTLDYMAPEQADDSHDVDARADVYSLGATMFKLLTGTAPYETSERRTPLQKMKALATIDAPSVKTRQPCLPDEVAAIVDRMLLRDPGLRFQTTAEVAQAVAPFCGGHRLAALTQQAMQSRHHSLSDEPSSRHVESNKPARHQVEPAIAGMPDAVAVIKDVAMAARVTGVMWPPRRLITRSVMATLGIVFVIAAGILIRIRTDTGTLIIECTTSDLPVEIRQGKEAVKQMTLLTGENKITLRSGSYEIVLPTKYDSLTLDAGKFELSRGGEWIARISEKAESTPIADVGDNSTELVDTVDLLPPQSAKFTGPSVTPDVAHIITDPIRQVEFQRLRDRYAELLRKIDALQDSLNADTVNLGDDHARVRMLQDALQVAKYQSDEVRGEMQMMLKMEEMTAEETAISAAKRTEAESVKPASTDTPQPLYAGKTFDQWLQVIQTERSTEELAKAIDAIGILGHGEHDRQAADAILNVIDRCKYVNPQRQTDDQGKLIVTAIRAIRSLNADEIIDTIVEGFKDRKPSVHEFVLDGLLQRPDMMTHGGGSNLVIGQTSLGSREPLASMLQASEPFAVQLIKLSEMNSGTLSPEVYPTILGNWDASDPVFNYIQSHVGISKPSSAVESYLRKFTVDPEKVPADKSLPYAAVPAARMLARHIPEDVFARIFVRAIQDNVRIGGTSQSGNGGLFGGGSPPSLLFPQMDAWHGLSELGSHAQSALPFMLEIIRHAADEDSIYNTAALVYWSRSEKPGYLYTANMRLFAIEFIALTETKNPAALDCFRAEFTRLIGHAPADRAFELKPGRQELLLSSDEVLSHGFSPSVWGKEPPKISPIDIELTNSCILAWKAITGSNPRFATGNCSGTLATLQLEDGYTNSRMPKFVSLEPDDRNTK